MNPQPNTTTFMAPEPVKLRGILRESVDTVSLSVEPPPLYGTWYPGQFNMLYIHGCGEAAISISGDHPLESGALALVHTVKGVGPLTKTMTTWKRPEDGEGLLYLRGPFGSHWPDVSANQDLLLIGGGIGLAPLRPMIRAALASASRRRLLILYGMKRPEEALYRYEWERWHRGWDVHFVLSSDHPSSGWEEHVGLITGLIPYLNIDGPNTVAMICGPEMMMRGAALELEKRGVNDRRIFVSIERHMKCAVALCGRCQWGPFFVCREGPIFCLHDLRTFWGIGEF